MASKLSIHTDEARPPSAWRGLARRARGALLAGCAAALVLAADARTQDAAPSDGATPATENVSATPAAEQRRDDALRAQSAAERRTEQVQANLEAVQEVLAIGLVGGEAGQLLREARGRAPVPKEVEKRLRDQERELAEARLDKVRLLERRRLEKDRTEVARLDDELAKQVAYLDALEGAVNAERVLLEKSQEITALLDSRLLWMASAPAVGPEWVASVIEGARWFGAPSNWADTGGALLREAASAPLIAAFLLLASGALAFWKRRLRARLGDLAADVGRVSKDRFGVTAEALGATVLLALPVPLLLGCVGLLLRQSSDGGFPVALAQGFLAAAAVSFVLASFRQVCRRGGLADVHFGWNERARLTLQSNLRWLQPIEVAAALVVRTCDASRVAQYEHGLGRLGFLVGSTALTLFAARVFLPGSGVFAELMSRSGLAWKLRRVWFGVLVGLPGGLVVAALAGYYSSAAEVQRRFFTSGVVVLIGIVVYSTFKRWLLVARRRIALQEALERRRKQREEAAAEAESSGSGEAVPDLDLPTMDVTAASAQTLALVRTLAAAGILAWLWAVWHELLPALEVLQGVEFRTPTIDASGAVTVKALTAWSLLVALLAAALTFVAARNLPAVLELLVLQRFKTDHGVRYAASTLTRYLVVSIGIIVISNLIGIDWSKAQWIVAALGVGLGFGLQEIVANFVSGLIILFERPIRVGDTVTVGEDSGTVTRLRIRATTITDWDNKEVLVPNKNFITDRVVNWTLSNPVTRLLLKVGVAYGTDEVLAQRTIFAAVKSVPSVLDEPAPTVFFVGFGDSSLDFEARVFVSDLSKRLVTLNEMHGAINRALRDAGIEIPFPQRDLHLRSSDVRFGGPPAAGPGPD